jgi:hypothetical protein
VAQAEEPSGGSAGEQARRLARAAWQRAQDDVWPQVRDRLEHRPAGPVSFPEQWPRPADRRLARQMARDAERFRQAQARAARDYEAAVSRRERLLRRSRQALPPWSAVTAGAAVATIPLDGGLSVAAATLAGAGALRLGVAVRRLWRPPPVPAPPAALQPGPPPPPHPRSAAFPAVRRLEQTRGALQSLVPLVAPSGRAAAEEAWHAAAEADTALRWQAARLAAAEPHRGVDPVLLETLESGVTAQEGLVQAVADLVAASADPCGADRLQDVTDRLHGLAAGLREVR